MKILIFESKNVIALLEYQLKIKWQTPYASILLYANSIADSKHITALTKSHTMKYYKYNRSAGC